MAFRFEPQTHTIGYAETTASSVAWCSGGPGTAVDVPPAVMTYPLPYTPSEGTLKVVYMDDTEETYWRIKDYYISQTIAWIKLECDVQIEIPVERIRRVEFTPSKKENTTNG